MQSFAAADFEGSVSESGELRRAEEPGMQRRQSDGPEAAAGVEVLDAGGGC